MSDLQLGLWLPDDWESLPPANLTEEIEGSTLDLLLVPENHDAWSRRERWKDFATRTETPIYAGFLEENGFRRGLLYDPSSELERTYTKHATADRLAFEVDEWEPEDALEPIEFRGTTVGTTICHDHYFSPLMGMQSVRGADVLINLSASPVKRRKWGEVLQARAIENSAYTFCTMHATEDDGTRPQSNQPHAFGFDPTGEPIMFTGLASGKEAHPFDTVPGDIYVTSVDAGLASDPAPPSRDSNPPEIERVRVNETPSPITGETAVTVEFSDGQLDFGDSTPAVDTGESANVSVDGFDISVIGMTAEDIFVPEEAHRRLLPPSFDGDAILFNVDATGASSAYLRNILVPVVRARCVEWCSPVIVSTEGGATGFHLANTAKDTHRINGPRIGIELSRAWGASSALKPVDGNHEPLARVAKKTAEHRSPNLNAPTREKTTSD